jgi:hypothetical protein
LELPKFLNFFQIFVDLITFFGIKISNWLNTLFSVSFVQMFGEQEHVSYEIISKEFGQPIHLAAAKLGKTI